MNLQPHNVFYFLLEGFTVLKINNIVLSYTAEQIMESASIRHWIKSFILMSCNILYYKFFMLHLAICHWWCLGNKSAAVLKLGLKIRNESFGLSFLITFFKKLAEIYMTCRINQLTCNMSIWQVFNNGNQWLRLLWCFSSLWCFLQKFVCYATLFGIFLPCFPPYLIFWFLFWRFACVPLSLRDVGHRCLRRHIKTTYYTSTYLFDTCCESKMESQNFHFWFFVSVWG